MTGLKRGVSPVIAVLLLIVIAVAAAILTYIWVIGFATSQTGTSAELSENIKVEAITLDASSRRLDAYIRNVGDTAVIITDIYLMDTDGRVLQRATVSYTINVNSVGTISRTFSYSITSGRTYLIKFVTQRGTEVIARVKAVP